MTADFKSYLANELWPSVPGASGAQVLAALFQMEMSQYLEPAKLLVNQFRQINAVVGHSIRTIPHYKNILKAAGFRRSTVMTRDLWQQVPVLTRRMVQQHQDEMVSRKVPESHGPLNEVRSSGSTGMPIRVFGTDVTQFYYRVCALRDHFWHRRDLSGTMAIIRFVEKGEAEYPGTRSPDWGMTTGGIINSGPAAMLTSSTDISLQAKFLLETNPDYMISYPSNLEALARYFIRNSLHLGKLRSVRAFGETIGEAVRPVCREAWGVELVDNYSAMEVGCIALQCPENADCYHVQSENLLVEVVDEAGRPCGPGEVGRVLLTTLHNFAMPLIRYEIGDYAEVGESCSCGRTLPVLKRILGRGRNMIVFPDGRKAWPATGLATGGRELPIRQFQLVQKSPERIEARLVTERGFTAGEEERVAEVLRESLGYPFIITITYMDTIPRSRGGKFEDFISEVDQTG